MGRRSKQEEKLLAQYAALSGQDLDELKAVASKNKIDSDNPHRTNSMQMEAALHFIRQPQGYVSRQCKECKEWFGSNYYHVAFCSDLCRSKDWERQMKVPWNFSGRHARERWQGEIPVVIHPTIWNNMKMIIEQMQELVDEGKAIVDPLDQEDSPEEEVQETLPQPLPQQPVEKISTESTSPLPEPSPSTGFLDFPEPSPFHL